MFETLILFWCADSVKNTIGPLYLAGRRAHVVQALDCLCRFSAAGFAVPKCLGQKPLKKQVETKLDLVMLNISIQVNRNIKTYT